MRISIRAWIIAGVGVALLAAGCIAFPSGGRASRGACDCPQVHPDCTCNHCRAVKAGLSPSEPCDCR